MVKLLANIRRWLDRLDAVVIDGAGRELTKPKKNKRALRYFLDWIDFKTLSFLDRVDSWVFFKGRSVRTPVGRVRSRGEKKLVSFFRKHGIAFKYEPELVLGKTKLHPDFYLLEYEVYVELWGMVYISPKYRAIMRLKKKLYEKYGIKVISILPKQMDHLEWHFPRLFEKITGKTINLPLTEKGDEAVKDF